MPSVYKTVYVVCDCDGTPVGDEEQWNNYMYGDLGRAQKVCTELNEHALGFADPEGQGHPFSVETFVLERDILERLKQWREIEDLCEKCDGSGTIATGSTALRGAGGQTVTSHRCPVCQGSGDKSRPWEEVAHATELKRSGVEKPCQKCHGLGRHIYSHGSTWRGGVGTCGGVWDICDACWGSGDATQPFEDRRAIEAEWKEQLAQASLEHWLGRGVMAHLYATHGDAQWVAREVIQFLESIDRRRKNIASTSAYGLIEVLKSSLRRLIGDKSDD